MKYHSKKKGWGDRYNRGSGDYLQAEIDKASNGGLYLRYHVGKRFCESCQSYKPKGNRLAAKGWKCDECKDAAGKKQ